MIAIIRGELRKTVMNNPEKGKPHQSLFVIQETENFVETVKIKDFELNRKHQVGQLCEVTCNVRNWAMNGRDGLSISLINIVFQSEGNRRSKVAV